MLLPALSRSVGVISQNGGYRGNPIPISMLSDKRNNLPGQASSIGRSEVSCWHFSDLTGPTDDVRS
jgi:hypothetical protein